MQRSQVRLSADGATSKSSCHAASPSRASAAHGRCAGAPGRCSCPRASRAPAHRALRIHRRAPRRRAHHAADPQVRAAPWSSSRQSLRRGGRQRAYRAPSTPLQKHGISTLGEWIGDLRQYSAAARGQRCRRQLWTHGHEIDCRPPTRRGRRPAHLELSPRSVSHPFSRLRAAPYLESWQMLLMRPRTRRALALLAVASLVGARAASRSVAMVSSIPASSAAPAQRMVALAVAAVPHAYRACRQSVCRRR